MNRVETVAIRFKPIDSQLGVGLADLHGLSPVVMFGRQGLQPAHTQELVLAGPSELAAGGNFNPGVESHEQTRGGELQQPHELHDIIFLVDRSYSMLEALDAQRDAHLSKKQYLAQRIKALAPDYLVTEDAAVSVVGFNDTAEVLARRDPHGIATVQNIFEKGRLEISGNTNFYRALQSCREIITEGRARVGNSYRAVVCLLTDGYGNREEDLATLAMRDLREYNCGIVIGGIGKQYSVDRIVELAGQGGPSSWTHLPIERAPKNAPNGYHDLFHGFIPRVINETRLNDHFLTFTIAGDFHRLTAASLSIIPAPKGDVSLIAGYVQTARGVLFEGRRKNLDLSLEVVPFSGSKEKEILTVPIVDEAHSASQFDVLQEARAVLTQWLISMGFRNRDDTQSARTHNWAHGSEGYRQYIDSLRGRSAVDPDDMTRRNDDSVVGTVVSSRDLRGDSLQSPPGDERVNDWSRVSYGGSQNYENDPKNLHSGGLGWLDVSANQESLPPLQGVDAGAYQQAFGGIRPVLEWRSSKVTRLNIDLAQLLFKHTQVTLGRKPECQIVVTHDDAVSREHCEFSLVDGNLTLRDLGSRNGTFVNGVQLKVGERARLHSGDTVRIASAQFTVKW